MMSKNKTGRASTLRVSENEKRTHTVSTRLNQEELSWLDEARSKVKMKRGEFLRSASLYKLPPTVPEINRQAWAELARYGSNLNQISRRLNEGDPLLRNLQELKDLVANLRTSLMRAKDES
jgi:hypothetical protein